MFVIGVLCVCVCLFYLGYKTPPKLSLAIRLSDNFQFILAELFLQRTFLRGVDQHCRAVSSLSLFFPSLPLPPLNKIIKCIFLRKKINRLFASRTTRSVARALYFVFVMEFDFFFFFSFFFQWACGKRKKNCASVTLKTDLNTRDLKGLSLS